LTGKEQDWTSPNDEWVDSGGLPGLEEFAQKSPKFIDKHRLNMFKKQAKQLIAPTKSCTSTSLIYL
jgi:hypothetical protein